MLAGIYTEQLNWSEAQNLLKKCIELSPDNGYTKYFSMGQLCEGEESVLYYKKGIQIIEKELENAENVDPSEKITRSSLLKSLSDAYCSVAELFMTDCCFAENAEGKCYESLEAAIKVDPSNPEAYQCLANFHLVKEQIKEAKDAIEKSLSLWLPQHEAFRNGECNPITNDLENVIPGYDSRIKTSKLLIELEMFEEAVKVLDGLIEDDDEIVEVWYLLGWTNYLHGDEYKLNSLYYFNKAKKVAAKTGQEDDDMLSHINELLEELNAAYPDYCEDEEIENEYNSDFSSDSESENKMET
ncbi:probable assembly chaperone of rpl4 [Stegodyphus dumicola]|uniref:probable assembly chaperone of rpl4 n=1 Tax=Stegodyphus dumicola TaxID=202533 RepID=UPI0015B19719|nr:probable assembly chaperone of rpl4 [Stegodyphus dumicola]